MTVHSGCDNCAFSFLFLNLKPIFSSIMLIFSLFFTSGLRSVWQFLIFYFYLSTASDQGESSEKQKPLTPQATPSPNQKPKQFVWTSVGTTSPQWLVWRAALKRWGIHSSSALIGDSLADTDYFSKSPIRAMNYNNSQDSLGLI